MDATIVYSELSQPLSSLVSFYTALPTPPPALPAASCCLCLCVYADGCAHYLLRALPAPEPTSILQHSPTHQPLLPPAAFVYMQMDAPIIFSELSQPLSPLAPYYATLPPPSEVFSYFEMPLEYGPIIQHAATVRDSVRSG
jgi:hypothetical protein